MDGHHFAEVILLDGEPLLQASGLRGEAFIHALQQRVGPPVGFFNAPLGFPSVPFALFFALLFIFFFPLFAFFPEPLVLFLAFLPEPLVMFLPFLPALLLLFFAFLPEPLVSCFAFPSVPFVAFGEHAIHAFVEPSNVRIKFAAQDPTVADVAVSFGS